MLYSMTPFFFFHARPRYLLLAENAHVTQHLSHSQLRALPVGPDTASRAA
jgi:hypothetical protein